jgi:dipeptidyl aminopeptidase/acylaminoacyl peptidase
VTVAEGEAPLERRPPWQQRFAAARVSLPRWARQAPARTVYSTNASGVWQLSSWDLATGTHTELTSKPTGVLGGTLLPDGSGAVWFDDHDGDEVGRWMVTPFEGGAAVPLLADVPDGWSTGLSLRPGRTVVGVSARGSFRIWVADDAGTRILATHEHPVGVGGLSADARLVALEHTEHGDVLHPSTRVLDANDGDVVAELPGGDNVTTVPVAWSPVPGDSRLAVSTDRSGRTRPEVWDPTTWDRTALRLDLPGEVGVADWWPDATALLLVHDHEGRSELYRYVLATDALEPLGLGPGTVTGAQVRPDGAIWYGFGTGSRPSEVRVADGEGDRVLLRAPGSRPPEGAPYESIRYPNGDGDTVHAFLARPPGPGPHPVALEIHGGPQAHVTDRMDPFVQAWVDHGFAVLMPNYRGSTGYGKRWEDALQGDPGRPELVDVLAGARHLIDKGIADPDRVVLTGASWGGYLTLQGLGTQPDAWAAGVATIPVADYPTAYRDESPDLQEFDRALFGGTPDELPDLYADRSPLTHVDAVRAPVLIITGANDTRCPRDQVDNYVAALAERGVPHRYDVFDAGHGSLDVEESIRQQGLALDFCAEHLGTPPAQR